MKKMFFLLLTLIVGMNMSAIEKINGVYQVSSASDMADFANLVNSGDYEANAVLTADIDEYRGPVIADADNYYAGTFDGQCHKITYYSEAAEARWGLFRTLSGVVKNLHVAGTLTTSINQCGGIVGFIHGGTIENCVSTVDIISTFSGDSGTGGVVATSMLPSTLKNCVFAGTIQSESAYSCGGIMAWIASAGAGTRVENCFVISEIQANTKDGNIITRNPSNAVIVNCYYVHPFGSTPAGVQQVTEAQVKNGEFCFLLNRNQSEALWTQKLNTDEFPKPFATEDKVYAIPSEGFTCGGEPLGNVTYSNTDPGTQIPPHTFIDGICSVCGQTDKNYVAQNADGFYELATKAQLAWFATRVNSGENALNAVLVADIENYMGPMIGTTTTYYAGTFDGQSHRITYETEPTEAIWALFRTLSGVVKNLHVGGTITTTQKQCATIVGFLYGGTIENCLSTANIVSSFSGDSGMGGIVASATLTRGYISNTIFAGTIQGDKAHSCGGLVGWITGTGNLDISNCAFIGEVKTQTKNGNTITRNPGRATITNCYYLNSLSAVPGGTTQVTEEQIKSGELCYNLGGAFRQSIGYDEIPTLDIAHGIVNKIGTTGNATQYIAGSNVQVPEGVTAYSAFIDAPWIALRPLANIIPVGTAVILQGAEGYYSFMPTADAPAVENNDLKGTAEPLVADGTQYVLAEKDGVIGFYQAQAGTTIPAGKAYIEYVGAGVKGFFFDGATGIDLTPALSQREGASAIFDLSGRRVEKPVKGMYIINGKKILK